MEVFLPYFRTIRGWEERGSQKKGTRFDKRLALQLTILTLKEKA